LKNRFVVGLLAISIDPSPKWTKQSSAQFTASFLAPFPGNGVERAILRNLGLLAIELARVGSSDITEGGLGLPVFATKDQNDV